MSQINSRDIFVIVRVAVVLAIIALNILAFIAFVVFPFVSMVTSGLERLSTHPIQHIQMSTIQILTALAQVIAVIVLISTLIVIWRSVRAQKELLAAQFLHDVFGKVKRLPKEEYVFPGGEKDVRRAVSPKDHGPNSVRAPCQDLPLEISPNVPLVRGSLSRSTSNHYQESP